MKDVSLEAAPTTEPGADAELIERARAVLEANWLGHATSPVAAALSASVELGRRLHRHRVRVLEPVASGDRSCGRCSPGSGANGLLPHIVFTDGASYFPGPDFWQTERSADAPERPRTSGIVQPPIHATAALAGVPSARADRRAGDGVSRGALPEARGVARVPLSRALPERGRSRRDLAPVGVRDGQLPALGRGARADVADSASIPEYERVDVEVADASRAPVRRRVRPLRLPRRPVSRARVRLSRIRDAVPFALQPVLFNSLLVQSNRGSGRDRAHRRRRTPEPFEAWAESTAAGLESAVGRRAGGVRRLRRHRREAGRRRARRPVSRRSMRACPTRSAGGAHGRTTRGLAGARRRLRLGRDEPLARRSGLPADALLARAGVADPQLGAPARARSLRVPRARRARSGGASSTWRGAPASASTTAPLTGKGHGGEQFAWTAALVLDLCSRTAGTTEAAG